MTGIALTRPLRRRKTALRQMLAALSRWARRAELRRYVSRIDDQALADIGVSRAQALFELDRNPPAL